MEAKRYIEEYGVEPEMAKAMEEHDNREMAKFNEMLENVKDLLVKDINDRRMAKNAEKIGKRA
jgi:hypothetical protein